MAEPMYRQIAKDLQRKIESGALQHGSQLPTEIELRFQYDASRNTVSSAIRWLTSRGLVETRPGQGTFVTERIIPFVTTLTGEPHSGDEAVHFAEMFASSRAPETSEPRVEIQRASHVVASALHIEAGAQVVVRHQLRFIDDTPWSLQTSYYPMTLVEQGATKLIRAMGIPEGAIAYLAETCGIKQVGYRDTVAMRVPDETETAFLGLPGDGRIAVFEIFRVAFDEMGNRIRLTITAYPADRNRFVINVGDVPPQGTDPL